MALLCILPRHSLSELLVANLGGFSPWFSLRRKEQTFPGLQALPSLEWDQNISGISASNEPLDQLFHLDTGVGIYCGRNSRAVSSYNTELRNRLDK